ncbi:MAG: hypothetical protein BYD32DRAFT_464193 [Podila humilis]|nr:MAG: hypothetical protein BYD32DRAFT_464193 [Podila humilis]
MLGVISRLDRDFYILRSLWTVNNFFFRVSAPLLFDCGVLGTYNKDQLLALLLSSIVHHLNEGELLAKVSDMDVFSANISSPFNLFELQLAEPVNFPSLLLSGPEFLTTKAPTIELDADISVQEI